MCARELLRHAELLDLANDAIVISDADGKISYWNRGAERLYGWSREEATGREVHTFLQTGPPEKLAAVLETLQAAHHWQGEIEQVRRDGVAIIVSTGWTLQGDDPAASLLQLSIDVTSRIAAEEALRRSEERYRRFVEEDLTGNLMMRPDGTIVTCNPAFARIFGFDSIDEARAANFLSLLQDEKRGRETCWPAFALTKARTPRAGDARARRRHGLRRGQVHRQLRRRRASSRK